MCDTYITKGDRIYLRPLDRGDINNRYLSWFSDEEINFYLEVSSLSYDDVVKYIEQGIANDVYYLYAICLMGSNLHIGNIKLGPINNKHKYSDLVTVIGDKNYWMQGFATEAIKLGNKIAFQNYNIRKLSGGIYSDNIKSIKCYLKADWVIEGVLFAHYILHNKVLDRICISCFNPNYFGKEDMLMVREKHNDYCKVIFNPL